MKNNSSKQTPRLPMDVRRAIKKAILEECKIRVQKHKETFIAESYGDYYNNSFDSVDKKTFRLFFSERHTSSVPSNNTITHLCHYFLNESPKDWLKSQKVRAQQSIDSEHLPSCHWTGIEKIEPYVDAETPLKFIRSQIESFVSSTDKITAQEVWIYEGILDEIMNRTAKRYVEMLDRGTTLKILMIDPFAEEAYQLLAKGINRDKVTLEVKLKAGLHDLLFTMFHWKKHCERELGGFSAEKASQIQVRFHSRVPFSRCYLICPTSLATKSLIFPTIDYYHQSASPGYTCTHNKKGLVRSFYLPGIEHIWEKESISLYEFDKTHPEYLESEDQKILSKYQEILKLVNL